MNDLFFTRMSLFLSFLLLLVAFHPTNAASVASGNARALGVNDPRGAFGFSVDHAHDILRRQDNGSTLAAPPQTTPVAPPTTAAAAPTTDAALQTTATAPQTTAAAPPTTCATISPLCPGTGDCCSGICCATACCTGGTICSGGQCVANNPTPDPNTATTGAGTDTTVAAQTTTAGGGVPTDTTADTAAATTTNPTGTAPSPTDAALTTIVPSSDPLNTIVSNGTAATPAATTLAFQVSGTSTVAIEISGIDSEDAGATATQTFYMDYNVTTISNDQGAQFITYGTFTESSAIIPTDTGAAAPSQTPLYVQQVPPTVVNNPNVQMQYEPTDAWATSGSDAGSDNGGSSPGDTNNGTSSVTRPISLCNNGTKISNEIGSSIKLQFTGVEASLLIVPSFRGAKYEIKFDDEIPKILNSYKEDGDTCSPMTPWIRTGLDNKPHNVTITIKGDAGAAAGSAGQLEFSGLIFKGPQSKSSSGTNKWVIVGVSIGALLLVIALVVLLVLCIRKRKQRSRSPVTPESAPPHSRQSTQPMAPQLYTPSHMRGDSNLSSGQPSLPSSPQMAYRTSFAPVGQQPNHGSPGMHTRTISGSPSVHTRTISAGSPSMHARNTSWVDGGLPPGAGYATPYSVTQPVGGVGSSNVPTAPFSIPVSVSYSNTTNGNGNGTGGGIPRHSFAQGHERTGSNLSINRNPFE